MYAYSRRPVRLLPAACRNQKAHGVAAGYRRGVRDVLLLVYLEEVVAGVVGPDAVCNFLQCLGFPGAWII